MKPQTIVNIGFGLLAIGVFCNGLESIGIDMAEVKMQKLHQ